MTLQEIKEEATYLGFPKEQLTPLMKAIEEGNDIHAWQIFLGNRLWINEYGIPLPDNIEQLAEGVGVKYHFNGQVSERCHYVNGKRHGEMVIYYRNGEEWIRYHYVNGDRQNG